MKFKNTNFQIFVLVVGSIIAIVKFLVYFNTGSNSVLSDALESIVNILAGSFTLYSLYLSSLPADQRHPYGHGKIEPLVTFLLVGFLVVSATVIAHESIQNIQRPHELPEKWTLIILLLIIIWKEISFRIVIRNSEETKSSSLKADAWHHRSDAITSIAAFVGISIALFLGKGYEAADDWAALFASAFILYNSYLIFRPALGEIMDEHFYDDLVEDIRRISLTVDGIIDTEKCFIRKVGMIYHVDLHAKVDGNISVTEGHILAHQLKDTLRNKIPQLGHVLIHIEPY
jgi:cation diffusion facilitator family transporter